MIINWTLVAVSAVIVTGGLEYIKGYFPAAPGNTWRVILLPLCFIAAAVVEYLPPFVSYGLVTLAVCQIGYGSVIELIRKKIGGAA